MLLSRYMRDMRYESSSYGPPSLSSNYQMSPFGGGDSYRPDRDRDRDVPPSPGGHLAYYERDRLDDRDYYGRGPSRNSGGNSGIAGGPMSDYDRYRAGSGRGRPTWGPKDDSNRRLLDRDRPERITTSNMDMTRSGRTSPTSYSATSTPTKDRLPISATFDIIKPDESSKKEASETSTQLNEEKVEEKDISSKAFVSKEPTFEY